MKRRKPGTERLSVVFVTADPTAFLTGASFSSIGFHNLGEGQVQFCADLCKAPQYVTQLIFERLPVFRGHDATAVVEDLLDFTRNLTHQTERRVYSRMVYVDELSG